MATESSMSIEHHRHQLNSAVPISRATAGHPLGLDRRFRVDVDDFDAVYDASPRTEHHQSGR